MSFYSILQNDENGCGQGNWPPLPSWVSVDEAGDIEDIVLVNDQDLALGRLDLLYAEFE